MVTIQPHLRKVLERLRAVQAKHGVPFVSRFAPSPTGLLHLGHVASAIFVHTITRSLGGRVLLRVEDHDKTRSSRPFEEEILNDLEWLGFEFDEGVRCSHERSPYRQSDDETPYHDAILRLASEHHIYRCLCSRKDIARCQQASDGGEYRYNGNCRNLRIGEDQPAGVRLAIENGCETFDDLWLGEQSQNPFAQCGDLLLRDRNGCFTYQFAVCVDDLRQGVNLVIRGEDILASTGRQILLARYLGRAQPPHFLHHPLISDNDGKKLGKRYGSAGIGNQRKSGVSAAEIIGQAAWFTGMISTPEAVTLNELLAIVKRDYE